MQFQVFYTYSKDKSDDDNERDPFTFRYAKVTDLACAPPGAPAIGTATATAPNQIQATWGNGSPAASAFNVYRATGTCA